MAFSALENRVLLRRIPNVFREGIFRLPGVYIANSVLEVINFASRLITAAFYFPGGETGVGSPPDDPAQNSSPGKRGTCVCFAPRARRCPDDFDN